MSRFKAKLWGETICDVYVDSRKDADALERAFKEVQGNYFLLGTAFGAILFGLPLLSYVVLS